MPLVNRENNNDDFNKKLDKIKNSLDDLQLWAIADGDAAAMLVPDVQKLVEELSEENTIQEVLAGISEIKQKMKEHDEKLSTMSSFISKMYQDGEINKDTFNKLDEFLKGYYDTSNLAEDY